MAKDALGQYCDLEQSLPKTTIHRRSIPNGYISPIKNNKLLEVKTEVPIIDDVEDYVEVEESASSLVIQYEENNYSNGNNIPNGEFQLAVLREVEFNINDADKANVEKLCNEVKRGRGRPKGYVMKKKDPSQQYDSDMKHSDIETQGDCGDRKNFSLKLDFLGPYQKHKTKLKRDKSSRDSTDDNGSPLPKKKSGRPLSINKEDNIMDENYSVISPLETIKSSNDNSFNNKNFENSTNSDFMTNQDKNDIKDSIDGNGVIQNSEKIINVKPITLEPRRRMGRPKGPPKPPKIKQKRGRKPNPDKERNKTRIVEDGNISQHPKIPGKRGRPKLYPDRPVRIKIPGRRVGRPPGPPKPFKPKGPRGRPRLIRINTSDRPYELFKQFNKIPTSNDAGENTNEEQLQQTIENGHPSELQTSENHLNFAYNAPLSSKKKRGRPIGYSPVGKTKKRLGRPPKKFKHGLQSRRGHGNGRYIGRGRPRKYNILLTNIMKRDDENTTNNQNEKLETNDLDTQLEAIKSEDESSEISVTDKNWETIVEDSHTDFKANSSSLENNDVVVVDGDDNDGDSSTSSSSSSNSSSDDDSSDSDDDDSDSDDDDTDSSDDDDDDDSDDDDNGNVNIENGTDVNCGDNL